MDDLPDGVRPQELENFKMIYTDSAFICRYRECDRYSDGFRTSAKRDEHEKMHAKPLRCADPTCEYWARGFTSRTGLQKHNRKYHPAPDELPLPDFELRREEQEPTRPPTPVQMRPPTSPTPPQESSTELEEEEEPQPKPQPKVKVSRAKRGKRVHNCVHCPKVRSEFFRFVP